MVQEKEVREETPIEAAPGAEAHVNAEPTTTTTPTAATATAEPCDETSSEDESDELDRLILAQLEKDDLDMERIRAEAHLALEGRLAHVGGLKTYNADEISAAKQAASNDVHYRGEKPKEVKQVKVNLGYGAKKRVKP
jgi:hypothetical protein